MDCREAEELFGPHLLGSLDAVERRLVDEHLETCEACGLRLQGAGETVARLAFAVPQRTVPARVKERLQARIDAEELRGPPYRPGLLGRVGLAFKRLSAGRATATAVAVLIVVLVSGGIWFNTRLSSVTSDNAEMQVQIQDVMEREAEVRKMVSDQRHLTSLATAPGVSVNVLRGTDNFTRAWGMLVCCALSDTGTVAVLSASNLRPLPSDQVYQVWLLTGGKEYKAGVLDVDETGYGQVTIIPPVLPFGEIDGIVITIEPSSGSPDPTGSDVLKSDL